MSSETDIVNLLSTSLEGSLTRLYRVELYYSQHNMMPINLDNAASELLEAECREASRRFIIGVLFEIGELRKPLRSLESESRRVRLIFHMTLGKHDPTPSDISKCCRSLLHFVGFSPWLGVALARSPRVHSIGHSLYYIATVYAGTARLSRNARLIRMLSKNIDIISLRLDKTC